MRRCAAINERLTRDYDRPVQWRVVPVVAGVLLVAVSVWVFVIYRDSFSTLIQSFGVFGVVVAIFLMTLLCIIPVPAEFLIVVNMEIYGIGWGLFYSWSGSVLGAIVAMYVTRWLGQARVRRLFSNERQQQVDNWIKRRGTMGLLVLRFAPFVPYHVLNYVAGLMNVRFWPFFWTTCLGLVPFYLWMGGVFLGFSHGMWPAIISALIALAILGLASYFLRKRWMSAFLGTNAEDKHSTRD